MTSTNRNIACFITPHGFGHAARACAVMAACRNLDPLVHFEIFTQVPLWFFAKSLPPCFTYHDDPIDVGLVQVSPFAEDLPATIQRLSKVYPPEHSRVDRLAHELAALGCQLALCDIAPLGIAAARAASIPSVLVENFTWDWIYTAFLPEEPRFNTFIPILQQLFASADFHIQTQPTCAPDPTADLTTSPVSRSPRLTRAETRAFLGISEDTPCVLVSMGGFPINPDRLPSFGKADGIVYVVPGGSQKFERRGSLVLLPHHTPIFHPDLVFACDALVGKSGYSTIAEAYFAGVPFGFVSRARFRESGPLSAYIRHKMDGIEIPASSFEDGTWANIVPTLLSQPRRHPLTQNGASTIAPFLISKINF